MIVTIHQPNYFPYFGLFHKVNQADVFVIQDDVKFDERVTNRNKIISSTGYTRLNVPISKGHKFLEIKDVKINKYPRGKTKPSDHTPIEIELA